MIFPVPIYVEERTSAGGMASAYLVRPLFHLEPEQRAEKLSRALTKLSNDLHEQLRGLGQNPRHDELAEWAFCPLLEEATVDLRLELASGSHRRNFFLAGYAALGRRLYFTPALPQLRFELLPGQDLTERATAVFTRYFRDLEKQGDTIDLNDYAPGGKVRITVLEVNLEPAAVAKKKEPATMALLFGGEEKKDGEQELRKTGRRLNGMYPDDLDRAIGRQREVDELAALMKGSDRRPVLLVGPRMVGKTAIVHELVRQTVAGKKQGFAGGREFWLLSPMRLISGMSYLGEWENRVLAILEYAKQKDRVLVFDDLLGLFTAGLSAASELNVAQVLRPWLEKRWVRVVGEITPEAWRVLRERDRTFADLFHVIPVNEPGENETYRVLIDVARQLEEAHRCAFELEVVHTVFELHRRFAPDAAFPGKAAAFLKRLALRHTGRRASRWDALREFQQSSGLDISLVDRGIAIERKRVVELLQRAVTGQDHVLNAFADVVVTLKARLNDPRRPLATMLLLGPTGVGKTQAAKALAAFLFGSEDRLLRFDMNEFAESYAVSRLTGTPREPEGLLTASVRRQPFSVVLFDEIEKAAPEVFDLLLAVLDEGRLTDALGRVTNFTQTVILLTSNLGVREARARIGFGAAQGAGEGEDAIYLSAAEKFFRPEFVNRLDRILPFRSLTREHLEVIAGQLLRGLLSRDGLVRRDGLLNITPAAVKHLAELGCHPQLGARALKRVVEREIAQPLAELLLSLPPGTPMVANVATKPEGFAVTVKHLNPVPQSVHWPERAARLSAAASRDIAIGIIDGANAFLDRLEAELEKSAPAGRIELGVLAPGQLHYFICREHLKRMDRLVKAVERNLHARPRASGTALARKKPGKVSLRQHFSQRPHPGQLRDAIALQHNFAELEAEPAEVRETPLTDLLRESALLEALAARPLDALPKLLVFRACLAADAKLMNPLADAYAEFIAQIWGPAAATPLEPLGAEDRLLRAIVGKPTGRIRAFYLNGLNVARFLPSGCNVILTRQASGSVGVILMSIEAITAELAARARVGTLAATLDAVEPGEFGPVLQRVIKDRTLTDFRTGLVLPAKPTAGEIRALLASALPLPPEVERAMGN